MTVRRVNVQRLVLTGMFAALLSVMSQIHIPMPSGMPVTLQTYAVALIGFFLGSRCAVQTVGVYILLGAVGIPVYSGFSGGPGILFGMTGGFIWGFLFLTAGCGWIDRNGNENKTSYMMIRNRVRKILFPAAGLVICHLLGIAQFSLVMDMRPAEAAVLVSLPYAVKDAASVILAYVTTKALRRRMGIVIFCA